MPDIQIWQINSHNFQGTMENQSNTWDKIIKKTVPKMA